MQQRRYGGQTSDLAWRTFVVPQYGTSVDYPAGIFVQAGDVKKGVGQRFESQDGRAVLAIYARDNEDGETPASYLKNNLRTDRYALDYERITRSFFAISLERDGLILLQPVQLFGPARGRDTLLRSHLPARRKAFLGSGGDTHQPLVAAERRLANACPQHEYPRPRDREPIRGHGEKIARAARAIIRRAAAAGSG